jgi:hypothetical protein
VKIARWAAWPAAVVFAVAAAACGGGGSAVPAASAPPSPPVLASEVKSALRGASSVHIDGSVVQSSKTVHLSLSLTRAGGVSGLLSVNGAEFTVLSTHGSTYIKVTPGFIRYVKMPATACTLVCGKYLKASAAQSQSLVGQFSMASLLGSMAGKTPSFHYGGTTTVNGQTAWVLHVTDGSTAYVAAHGTPYPLRVVAPPARHGQLNFTQWNSASIPSPPPASKVVDLSQLHG